MNAISENKLFYDPTKVNSYKTEINTLVSFTASHIKLAALFLS